ARRQKITVRRASPECTHRKATADRLRPRNAIRRESLSTRHAFEQTLVTREAACTEITALHFIDEQQEFLFVAEFAQSEKVFRTDRLNATLALDAFDENRRGSWRDRVANGFKIIVWNMPETRNRGAEAFFYLLLPGRGDTCQRAAVKGVQGRDDFKP